MEVGKYHDLFLGKKGESMSRVTISVALAAAALGAVLSASRPAEATLALTPAGDLQRAAFGSSALETIYHFDGGARVPSGGGTAIGVPADESWLIYRAVTRDAEALVLIEKFQ